MKFSVGDRVECNAEEGSYGPGVVVENNGIINDEQWYNVQLDSPPPRMSSAKKSILDFRDHELIIISEFYYENDFKERIRERLGHV